MAAGPEIQEFKTRIDTTANNLNALHKKLADFARYTGIASDVVEAIDTTGDIAEEATEQIDQQLSVLKAAKLVGPLKVPSKAYEKVLKAVRPVTDKIDKAVDKLNGKKDKNDNNGQPDEDGEFLDKLSNALGNASTSLSVTASAVKSMEERLVELSDTTGGYIKALNVATNGDYGSSFNGLKFDVDQQFATRNEAGETLEALYADIKGKVQGIIDIMQKAKVDIAFGGMGDLDAIDAFFNVMDKPLEIAAAIIKPIEPILDAVGFLFDLVVGPVIDFLTATLGIDALLDKVSDDIRAILPDATFLDEFEKRAQEMLDDLREFISDNFNIDGYLDEIEIAMFGDALGDVNSGPTGYGDDGDNTITAGGGDHIIDGRAGDDVINPGGGDDIIVASEGNDTVYGGAGTDMLYIDGFFSEFELTRKSKNDPLVITHVDPSNGARNYGSETLFNLRDLDFVVFNNISFTGIELDDALIGASVLDGTEEGDLMFLNSNALTDGDPTTNLNSDGQHEANGLEGDDRIFGSTQNDEINGGSGNDVLVHSRGNDEINGDSGSDTYQILNEATLRNIDIDLEAGSTAIESANNDTLSSIENIIVQRGGNHELIGSDLDNYILSAAGNDVLTGKGGDDFLVGGAGSDYLFGGAGEDTLEGGLGRDALISAGFAISGQSETFDGGAGEDLLSYTTEFWDLWNRWRPGQGSDSRVSAAFNDINSTPGRVRIYGDEGRVELLNSSGVVVAEDTVIDIESFQGSDFNDTIYGFSGGRDYTTFVDGAGGDDIVHSNGSLLTSGGSGDDTLVASAADTYHNITPNFNGGAGTDFLDMSAVGDARWYVHMNSDATSATIRAFDSTYSKALGSSGNFLQLNTSQIEQYVLGDFDDRVNFNPGGSNDLGDFTGGAGDDDFRADGGIAIIRAGEGADTAQYQTNGEFYGEEGNDYVRWNSTGSTHVINGGSGQDLAELVRFGGAIDGGTGFDTIAINRSGSAVRVDFVAGKVITFTTNGAAADNQIRADITNIEEAIGTNNRDTLIGSGGDDQFVGRNGNDNISGNGGEDKLYGGSGNDTLEGGAGNDFLHGGTGSDRLDGGAGSDTAYYSFVAPSNIDGGLGTGAFGAVNVDLTTGNVSGLQGNDTLISIENVFGTALNDTLRGNGEDNVLSGEDGNDTLRGEGGDDYLSTGRGTDRAEGGSGDDTFIIDVGDKTLIGGSGTDVLDLGTVDGEITLDFLARSYTAELKELRPVWNDTGTIEERSHGGQMTSPQEVRETEALFSNSNDDVSRPLPNFNASNWDEFRIRDKSFTESYSGTWSSIEEFTGGVASTLLLLSANVDKFDGSRGARDMIEMSNYATGISYNFSTGATNVQILMNDQLTGVEGIHASNFNDTITGHGDENILYGYDGNDRLTSAGGDDDVYDGKGNDTVSLGSGDDYVRVGGGRDTYSGGSGNDYISYYDSTGGIEVDLAANSIKGSWAVNDTISSFEGFSGSRYGEDIVYGTDGKNTLRTYGGNDDVWDRKGDDKVELGAGNDYVRVGGGKDSFDGGSGKDYISYYDSTGGVTVDLLAETAAGSWASNDEVKNFESISGSGTGADKIYGTNGSNTIKTFGGNDRVEDRSGNDKVELGSGNDYVRVGGGKDSFDGGSGTDYISYYDSTGGVTLNLGKNTASGSWAANDTIKSFESASGSGTGDDKITGSNGKNTIKTYGGDDDVWDLSGDDRVELGSGDDYVKVGGGKDSFDGGSGWDYISYYDSTNGVKVDLRSNVTAWSWASNDTIKGFEGVSGSKTGDDDLRGTETANTIRGYGGDDVIHGRGGNDKLYGGAGNDYFDTGAGNDTVWGGDGADTFHFDEDEDGDTIKDFQNNIDEIEFHNLPGVSTAAQALSFADQQGSDVFFDFGDGITLLVENITKGQLANDIVFA